MFIKKKPWTTHLFKEDLALMVILWIFYFVFWEKTILLLNAPSKVDFQGIKKMVLNQCFNFCIHNIYGWMNIQRSILYHLFSFYIFEYTIKWVGKSQKQLTRFYKKNKRRRNQNKIHMKAADQRARERAATK